MRFRTTTISVGVVLAIFCSSAVGQQTKKKGTENDEAQIRAVLQNVDDSAARKDIDGIMSSYWKSEKLVAFDVVPPRQYSGWDAYRKDWVEFLGPVENAKFEMTELAIEREGTLAYSRCILHF